MDAVPNDAIDALETRIQEQGMAIDSASVAVEVAAAAQSNSEPSGSAFLTVQRYAGRVRHEDALAELLQGAVAVSVQALKRRMATALAAAQARLSRAQAAHSAIETELHASEERLMCTGSVLRRAREVQRVSGHMEATATR